MSTAPNRVSPSGPTPSAVGWLDCLHHLLSCGRVLRDDLVGQLTRYGLTEAEFWLLWTCRQATAAGVPDWQGIAQNELAAAMMVSPPQVSVLVERLRRKGLLQGERSPDDRRRQLWRLASGGQAMLQEIVVGLSGWAARLDREHAVELDGTDRQSRPNPLFQLIAELNETLGPVPLRKRITPPGQRGAA